MKKVLIGTNPNPEIIDDAGLIQCINRLNAIKETGVDDNMSPDLESDILKDINRISSEMRWFSQWLTIKTRTAA